MFAELVRDVILGLVAGLITTIAMSLSGVFHQRSRVRPPALVTIASTLTTDYTKQLLRGHFGTESGY